MMNFPQLAVCIAGKHRFLHRLELFPFRSTFCATLLAVTLVWVVLVVGSFESLSMRAHALLLLCCSMQRVAPLREMVILAP